MKTGRPEQGGGGFNIKSDKPGQGGGGMKNHQTHWTSFWTVPIIQPLSK